MAAKIMTISMPEWLRDYVEYKVDAAGYGSVSEYFREPVRSDQRLELERFDAAVMRREDQSPERLRNYRDEG